MRSGTHFTQQKVFLLFTVVVTKHVWPYFQSHFPKTSSECVSSYGTILATILRGSSRTIWRKKKSQNKNFDDHIRTI